MYQPGLLDTAYDGDLYTGLRPYALDQLPAVRGLPHRARRDAGRMLHAAVSDRLAEAMERLDGPVDNLDGEMAGGEDVMPEPDGLPRSLDNVDLAVCQDVADGQPHRVGANVNGGKSCQ